MRKFWTILLIGGLMISGCGEKIDPANIPGKYYYNGDQDDQLEVYPNKHYRHVIFNDGEPEVTDGTWEMQSSNIVLHHFNFENKRVTGDFTAEIKKINGHWCLDYADGHTYFTKDH